MQFEGRSFVRDQAVHLVLHGSGQNEHRRNAPDLEVFTSQHPSELLPRGILALSWPARK